MTGWRLRVQKNIPALAMFAFAALFYVAAHALHQAAGDEALSAAGSEEREISSQEIREREILFERQLRARPEAARAATLLFLGVLLTGMLLGSIWLVYEIRGGPFLPVTGGQGPVRWGLSAVFFCFAFLFFSECVILLVEMALGCFVDLGAAGRSVLLMLNGLLRDTAVAALVLWILWRAGHRISEIGLTLRFFWKYVAIGLAGYLAMLPILFVMLVILSLVSRAASYEPPVQPVVQMYLQESAHSKLVFFTFFVALAGPLIEEIFFRGFTYRGLRHRLGRGWALFGTAAIFSSLHLTLVGFLPIFVLGLFLSYLYERTGSLVPSMTAHMVHNGLMVFLTLTFKSLAV